ncbi:NUDIX hydrolase [Paracoccus sp. S1E-3]|nr:NUDIX hydrolase [Paracoccus sp. S1E-3]MBA4491056.1 NUDIX hydrolase [Paracoccus sp. S1E-3]
MLAPGETPDFGGAKLILTCGPDLLACLRDDFAHIPWPAHWDLPGGGREGNETASACALRELHEEFGLRLPPDRLEGAFVFPNTSGGRASIFFTGRITRHEIAAIRFGDEGQCWQMMEIGAYVAHPRAVPHFRRRVAQCLGMEGPQGSAEAPQTG